MHVTIQGDPFSYRDDYSAKIAMFLRHFRASGFWSGFCGPCAGTRAAGKAVIADRCVGYGCLNFAAILAGSHPSTLSPRCRKLVGELSGLYQHRARSRQAGKTWIRLFASDDVTLYDPKGSRATSGSGGQFILAQHLVLDARFRGLCSIRRNWY